MYKKKLILSITPLFLLANTICLDANAEDKHPIEKSTEACLNKDNSTMNMLNCTSQAYKKWDKELNRVYKALRHKLKNNRKAKRALRKAQRAWLRYKKAEIRNINKFYGSLDGTMWGPIAADAKVDITKQRALTLKSYLDNLQVGD